MGASPLLSRLTLPHLACPLAHQYCSSGVAPIRLALSSDRLLAAVFHRRQTDHPHRLGAPDDYAGRHLSGSPNWRPAHFIHLTFFYSHPDHLAPGTAPGAGEVWRPSYPSAYPGFRSLPGDASLHPLSPHSGSRGRKDSGGPKGTRRRSQLWNLAQPSGKISWHFSPSSL